MQARVLIAGEARAEALASDAPLSFWGGYDHATGEIIDRRHPLSGQIAAHRVLILPYTIGSSTTTAVLLEAIRAGNAPAAIITRGPDKYLCLASIVAQEMYQRPVPVLSLEDAEFARIRTGQVITIHADGIVEVDSQEKTACPDGS
ncbi:MAG TPA: DUF126 domain-containing protein [Bryobacteraceae bacterium]|nr:DUF126 domain-containing protein [Bryobacteraceae bacterium]